MESGNTEKKRHGGDVFVRTSRHSRQWIAHSLLMMMMMMMMMMMAWPADAQVARSFDELLRNRALRSGDEVVVTNASGRHIKGDLVDMSSTGITIVDGRRALTVTDTEVQKIDLQDSLDNGIVLGLGLGVVVAFVACKMKQNLEQCGYAVGYIGFPAIAIGGVAGAIIDASIRKTVYQRPGSTRVEMFPFLSTDRLGVLMSATW